MLYYSDKNDDNVKKGIDLHIVAEEATKHFHCANTDSMLNSILPIECNYYNCSQFSEYIEELRKKHISPSRYNKTGLNPFKPYKQGTKRNEAKHLFFDRVANDYVLFMYNELSLPQNKANSMLKTLGEFKAYVKDCYNTEFKHRKEMFALHVHPATLQTGESK